MTKKQTAKLNAYHTTSNCLGGHATQVATLAALGALETVLNNNIDDIEDQAEIQQTIVVGAAGDKEAKRLGLCREASTTAGLVRAWAMASANVPTAELMDITYSDLNGMKGSLLAERCQTVHDTANTNLAALAPYGITAAKLTALQTLIDAYDAKSTAPRDAETQAMAATAALEALFKATDKMLKQQMDLLMNSFRDTDAQFYNQYKASRIIQDVATSNTQIKGLITKQADGTALAGAVISTTVNGNPVAATSNEQGKFKLVLPPGTYTVTTTLAGYQTKTVSGITLTLGEAEEVNVGMEV